MTACRQPSLSSMPSVTSEDDCIKANGKLIRELGPEPYLRNLLSILKGNYPRG
jgi:hypothetical protein